MPIRRFMDPHYTARQEQSRQLNARIADFSTRDQARGTAFSPPPQPQTPPRQAWPPMMPQMGAGGFPGVQMAGRGQGFVMGGYGPAMMPQMPGRYGA